jgi:hypothetical protein
MAGTIIPPAFNETTNPTLISFFLLQTIFPKLRSNLENQLKISLLLYKKDNEEQSLTER